jgi:RecA-family ATPase
MNLAELAPVDDLVARVQNWTPPDLEGKTVAPKFSVDGWIQEAKVGALVAGGGTGKTTLLMTLGICHATKRKFMGRAVKEGCFVLLSPDDSQEDLDFAFELVMRAMELTQVERNAALLRCRLVSLVGATGPLTFTYADSGGVHPTGIEESILEAVACVPDLVGLALDTLRQFSGGDSNSEQVIKLTVSAATRVAQRLGAYVILPHHTGKQNYRDGIADMYCGSGSAAIADNCRFVLLLQTATWADIESKVRRTGQERGDPLVLSSTRGSLLVKAPAPLYLHRDGYYFGHIAGATMSAEQQADNKDRKILQAVRGGATTKTRVCAVVGGRKKEQLDRIDALIGRGHLHDGGSQTGSGSKASLVVSTSGARLLDDAV